MTQQSADAGRDLSDRRPRRSGPRRSTTRRRLCSVLAASAVALALLGADAALLQTRVDRLDVALPAGDGTTWVLVGTDSRAALPAGAPATAFGTVDEVPGSRADVVLVVHESGDRTTTFSVPRDLVRWTGAGPTRLALTWADGPQATVDALCALGIPADHLVAVDLAGFAATVDAAGGVAVDVPAAVRDPAAGLLLTRTGPQRLDGRTALALVRSRHPEHLVDGAWVPAEVDVDGRASAAGTVLTALADAVRGAAARPWRWQTLAWAAAGAVSVDRGTSTADLLALAGTDVSGVQVLPAGLEGSSGLIRLPTAQTAAAVAAAGMSCAG